ncbi:hypothetical protein OPV22_022610 [Ensete ventricosum]|uniref:Uncharacterized protein n=1 Tax=Ensete ventricosum TaxID=4639 RepID=A0AAV8QQ85_ENSVE|nr:hypothetical protein OPV22_022610 [Ensete ventricosum]
MPALGFHVVVPTEGTFTSLVWHSRLDPKLERPGVLWEVERGLLRLGSTWKERVIDEEEEAPPEVTRSLRMEERPEMYGLRSCRKLRDYCAIVSGNKIR